MTSDEVTEILFKLLQRRDFIESEARALDNLISVYEGLLARQTSESRAEGGQLDLYKPSTRAAQAQAIAQSIEAARKLIIAEGRPMKRGELVMRLEKQGHHLPGRDKNKVFGTNIWRSGRFRTIGDEGYWPKDVKLPR